MRHRHPILPCEPGQVLIEAAISIGKMWVAVPDRDTFTLANPIFGVFIFHYENRYKSAIMTLLTKKSGDFIK